VPNYHIDGPQHYREPFKDKGAHANVTERREWSRTPKYNSRSEMNSRRRAERHPDLSFDIDGDGVVSSTDYFIAKHFSREQDRLRLSTAERKQAVAALESGFLDQYSFGHDQSGVQRLDTYQQMRGKIVTHDTAEEFADLYPPHWNADKEPAQKTRADLKFHRTASMRNSNNALRQAWDAAHPTYAFEPSVQQEQMVPKPEFTSLAQRKEAMRRSAREYAGMDGQNTSVNPHKEDDQLGLDYRPQPEITTRSQLQETRRAQKQEGLQEGRLRGEQDYVPKGSRLTMKAVEVFDRLRAAAQEGAMTFTKLKQQRKAQGIEHNMCNFSLKPPEDFGSTFSGQEKPWWTLRGDYVPEPPACLLKELQDPVARAEPSRKVTEAPPPLRILPPASSPPPFLRGSKAPAMETSGNAFQTPEISDHVLKQMTKEFALPKMTGIQDSRAFDGVKQAVTLATDFVPLPHFSTFDNVRVNSKRLCEESQQRTSREDSERAQAWHRFARDGPAAFDLVEAVAATPEALTSHGAHGPHGHGEAPSPAPPGPRTAAGVASATTTSATAPAVLLPETSFHPEATLGSISGHHHAPPTGGAAAKHALPVPVMVDASGEDPPMTERLERSAANPLATSGEKSDTASGVPSVGPARPVSERSLVRGGARHGAAVPSTSAHRDRDHLGMVVRSSGFQWLQHRAQLHHDMEVASTIGGLSSPQTSRLLSSMVPKGPGNGSLGSGTERVESTASLANQHQRRA
jgi:hypothetical protein